jgi:hypothetical protein
MDDAPTVGLLVQRLQSLGAVSGLCAVRGRLTRPSSSGSPSLLTIIANKIDSPSGTVLELPLIATLGSFVVLRRHAACGQSTDGESFDLSRTISSKRQSIKSAATTSLDLFSFVRRGNPPS